jgi:cyclic-di-GMP-binding protein
MASTPELELPGLSPQAAPEFTDAATAKAWLENVPLANVAAAQHQLHAQIAEFNRFDTRAVSRLATLEAVREAVHFVQIEQARRFTNRALPMAEAEASAFEETVSLWDQMRIGYLRCLEAVQAGDAAAAPQAALLCQRELAYTGLKMFHYHRAYRLVPPREWRSLHAGYARAVKLEVAETQVKDYLNRDVNDTSPRIAYMRAALLGMANPNELSQRQLTFVAFLLERWAEKAEVREAPPEEEDAPPLVADLAGEACPERGGGKAAKPAYLDLRRLSKSLRNRIGLLRKGESPAKLALGEDCVQPSCEHLLVFLYRQWCQARQPRSVERKRAGSDAQACNDLAAIHYYITGRVFRQPGEAKELTAQQRQEIATCGRVSTRDEDDYSVVHGFLLEHWQLDDESSQGLKMVRRAGNPGRRYTHGQLIGVRPADSKSFMLGTVRWLAQNDAGDLYAGIRLLPGLPAAVAVRPTGINVLDAKYVQGLSLTAVAALNSPPTLVLPAGWFKPRRVIEVFIDSPVRVRLIEMLDRGSDCERVAYEILS